MTRCQHEIGAEGRCVHCGKPRWPCARGRHEVDELADEPDRCTICGRLVCPDCERDVNYDSASGSYWHSGSVHCFLHPNEATRRRE